ncbi:hypothetical protein [Streptomyces sp. NPDC051909]|uniref:hypothetical protein n=1 Tax=Streptomyces sp. NPDC051909 TaxID=3154944 RepID=UPI003416BE6D
MTTQRHVTVLHLDETVLHESPIFAALARLWFRSGRYVPGLPDHVWEPDHAWEPAHEPDRVLRLKRVPLSREQRPVEPTLEHP